MNMSTKARVVLAPLGVPVSEDGKKNMSTWEAARESFKKDPKTFPDTIGFEAWCSLMSFDVGKVEVLRLQLLVSTLWGLALTLIITYLVL